MVLVNIIHSARCEKANRGAALPLLWLLNNTYIYSIRYGTRMANIRSKTFTPLAGYGLPPPRGNFVDHIFLEAQCLAKILQHVSPLTTAALSCNSLLYTLPYKIFDN